MSLFCELGLQHETTLSRLIEEVGTIGKPIIAELLCDALRIGAFRTFFNEVVEEAEDLEVEALEAVVLVIVQLLSDCVVVALQEVLALLIRGLFVLHGVELVLLGHLLLQLDEELVLDLAHSCLVKYLHRVRLRVLKYLLQLLLKHRAPLAEFVVKKFLEDLVGVHRGLLALILANVAPAGLDAWHGTGIDRIDIRLGKIEQHLAVEGLLIQLLRLDAVEDLSTQNVHLLDEFWT